MSFATLKVWYGCVVMSGKEGVCYVVVENEEMPRKVV